MIAATVGTGRSSNRFSIVVTEATICATASSPPANRPPNSVTSAPTMNTDLPEVTMTPLTDGSFAIAWVAASKSLSATWFNLLTESPARSNRSSTTPSSNIVVLNAGPE